MTGPEIADPARARVLLKALEVYVHARRHLLEVLHLPASNRDPLAEASEQVVAALLGGTLAVSRVQAGHDLVLPGGTLVQVKYLANPAGGWINEHTVRSVAGVDLYALVLFEAFEIIGVLVFPTDQLAPICHALVKRHPDQERQLQFTRRNWLKIKDDPKRFRRLGVGVWLPPLVP